MTQKKRVTIKGNGITLNGNGNRIFTVEDATLILENLKLINGVGTTETGTQIAVGGAIYINNANVTINDAICPKFCSDNWPSNLSSNRSIPSREEKSANERKTKLATKNTAIYSHGCFIFVFL